MLYGAMHRYFLTPEIRLRNSRETEVLSHKEHPVCVTKTGRLTLFMEVKLYVFRHWRRVLIL